MDKASEFRYQKRAIIQSIQEAIDRFEEATGFQVDKVDRTTDNKNLIVWINEEKGDYKALYKGKED